MKGMAYNGWKLGLPDKFWPVTLDDFFGKPDEIRKLGLHLLEEKKESSEDGDWPGHRTELLHKIDEGYYAGFIQKIVVAILNCYFNLDVEQVWWNHAHIQFQIIPSFDKDKNSAKNKGWVHRDGVEPPAEHKPIEEGDFIGHDAFIRPELAGLIYLTPDIERDTGTSLFNMKKDQTLEHFNSIEKIQRQIHLGNPVNDEEAKDKWEKHRSCFIEKVRFENIYNRLIMYDAKEFHAANSFYTPEDQDNRLTLAFFIGGIHANKWPLQRLRNI
jgi:hypothetical protein